ncbi:hypothetical protein BJV82DRAFT_412188 [Fennellomyces sp. T-0311]|nr:hypothetical protein BJV82DRAFT_412188 [Fennellomyces sp. T-0311]
MAYANNGGASPHSNGSYSSYWTAASAQDQSFDRQNERIERLRKSIREQSILLSVVDTDDSTNIEELKRKIRNVSHELKNSKRQPAWTRYELNMRRLQDLTDEGHTLKKEIDYLINIGVKNVQAELDADHPDVQRIVNDIDKLHQDAHETLKFDLPVIDGYHDMNRKQNRDRQMFEKGLFVSEQVARFIDQLEHEPRFTTSPLSYDKPRSAPSIIRNDEDYLSYNPTPPPVPTTQRPGSPRSAADIKAEAQRRIEQRRLLFVNKYPKQQRSSENLRRKSEDPDISQDEKAAQERLRKAEADARERLQNVQKQRAKARQDAEEKRKQAAAQREAEQREQERLRQLEEEQERKEQEALAEHRRKVEAEAMERRRKEIEEQERRERELALKREEEEKAAEEVRQRRIRQAAERAAREKRLRQEEIERKEREREAARLEAEKRRREWLEAEEKRRQEKEAARLEQEDKERRIREEEERRKQEELDAQRRKEEEEKAAAEAEAEAAAVEAAAIQSNNDLAQSDIEAPAMQQNSTAGTSGYGVDIEDEVDFTTIYRVKSLYEYQGARNDDLSFGEDEIIKAHPHKETASDWWYGTSLTTKQVGFFPRAYVEIVEEAFRVRALYDFTKTREDDLAFVENEIIVIQPFQDDDSDWWYGTSEDSNLSGYFPKSYVDVINPGVPAIQLPDTTPLASTTSSSQRETTYEEPHRGMSAPSTPIMKKQTLTVSRKETGRRRRAASNVGLLGNTEVPIGRARAMSVPSSRPSSPALLTWASTMDGQELDAIPPEERKRQEAIFELISTEKTYLRDLQLIINVFYADSSKYLTRDEQDVVFSNIDDLLLCNTALLSDLESRQHEGAGVVSNIGDVFLKHAENLTCYSTYCRNQSFASRFLQDKRQQDQWFNVFLKTAQSRPECRALDLSHFLLEPMQRITRYPLLLQNILHATPKKHPDYGVLRSALAKSSHILQNVNEETRRYENSQKMRELSRLLDMGDYGRLDLPSREFVMEGVLYKAKSGRKLHGYLFNDILILTEPLKGLSPEGYLYRLYKEVRASTFFNSDSSAAFAYL